MSLGSIELSLILRHRQFRGAMRATGGLDRDGGQAEWALFRRRFGRWCFLFPPQPVDGADEQEDHKGDDEEADDGIDEHAVVDCHCACCLRIGQ